MHIAASRLGLVAFIIGLAHPSLADESLDQAKTHYARGVEQFNAGRYAEAVKELEAAYALKPIAKFLVEIAKTYVKLENNPQALRYARQFLREARVGDADRLDIEQMVQTLEAEVDQTEAQETEIPAPLEVPGVDPAEEEPETAKTATGASAPGAGSKRPGRAITALIHTPVDDANVGRRIPIVVEPPPGIDARQVILFYRDAGRGSFSEVELEQQGYAFVGAIPGRHVLSSSIQYYLEARNVAGRAVAMSANPYTPHIIVVAGGRRPRYSSDKGPEPRYRTWTWTLAAAGGAFLGTGTAFAFLARDRQNALEAAVVDSQAADMPFRWDFEDIRDLETQGASFSALAKVFVVLGVAAAAGAGTLWYLDYQTTHRPVTQIMPMSELHLTPLGLEGRF